MTTLVDMPVNSIPPTVDVEALGLKRKTAGPQAWVDVGKAVYLLNKDWVEVQEGDFMLLRAFCPQACYAGGPGRFRYLLYKDVNRRATLGRQLI